MYYHLSGKGVFGVNFKFQVFMGQSYKQEQVG